MSNFDDSRETRLVLQRDIFSIKEESDKDAIIEGYTANFNQPTIVYGLFEEVIDEGAFDAVLAKSPYVRALFNHDASQLLGTTKAGTLKLRADSNGLFMECSPSTKTSVGSNVLEWIRRGEIDGQSFAFTIKRQEWVFAEQGSGKMDLRRILEVGELYDVGPVTYPAYSSTSITLQKQAERLHEEARSRFGTHKVYYKHWEKSDSGEIFSRGIGAFELRSENGSWVEEVFNKEEAKNNEKTPKQQNEEATQEVAGEQTIQEEKGNDSQSSNEELQPVARDENEEVAKEEGIRSGELSNEVDVDKTLTHLQKEIELKRKLFERCHKEGYYSVSEKNNLLK